MRFSNRFSAWVAIFFFSLMLCSCSNTVADRPFTKKNESFLSRKEYEKAINAYAKPVIIGTKILYDYRNFFIGSYYSYLDIPKQRINIYKNGRWTTRYLPRNLFRIKNICSDGDKLLYISERGHAYYLGLLDDRPVWEIRLPFRWMKGSGDKIDIYVMKASQYVVYTFDGSVGKNLLIVKNGQVSKASEDGGYSVRGVTEDRIYSVTLTDNYKEIPPDIVLDSSLKRIGRAPDILWPENLRGGSYTEAKSGSSFHILGPQFIDTKGNFYLLSLPENRKDAYYWKLNTELRPVARLTLARDPDDISWAPNGDAYYEIQKGKESIIYWAKYKGP